MNKRLEVNLRSTSACQPAAARMQYLVISSVTETKTISTQKGVTFHLSATALGRLPKIGFHYGERILLFWKEFSLRGMQCPKLGTA